MWGVLTSYPIQLEATSCLEPQVTSSLGILSARSQRRNDWAGLLPRMHSGLTCAVLRPPAPSGQGCYVRGWRDREERLQGEATSLFLLTFPNTNDNMELTANLEKSGKNSKNNFFPDEKLWF